MANEKGNDRCTYSYIAYFFSFYFNLIIISLTHFQTKTGGFALVYCLNIGIDPPDVIKTDPCARLECWLGNKSSISSPHNAQIPPHFLNKKLSK